MVFFDEKLRELERKNPVDPNTRLPSAERLKPEWIRVAKEYLGMSGPRDDETSQNSLASLVWSLYLIAAKLDHCENEIAKLRRQREQLEPSEETKTLTQLFRSYVQRQTSS